jgi:hypothetical protein
MVRFITKLPKQKMALGSLSAIVILCAMLVFPHQAFAQYVENNLVDDGYFLDAASMGQGEIQSFLTARGGYIGNTNNTFWSDRDGAAVTSTRIIYEASQDYGISAKVIMATMQKEQSLVTAKNPTASQVNFAMGYGCPDSTGCGTSYVGLYKQVDNATWQLRYNFERARGNNNWWRVSSSYACGSASRFYSTGLYMGRYVTFYDGAGTGYKAFTLNNAATASMYCYTPHAYPGSASQYYSGSYNFVSAYEMWFGSTQPSAVVSSPLTIKGLSQGTFTNTPITASFTIKNNCNWAVGIGKMGVAVRDQNGNNFDFGLQPVNIPANGSYTYTSTQTLSTEGTYTFFITNLNGGAWSESSPPSSSIDNPRSVTTAVTAMPTITVSPATNVTDMRENKDSQLSFTVRNNSAQTMNVGKLSLGVRGPNGENYDRPLQSVNLAAGASYAYTSSFTPPKAGAYYAFVTATKDNGATWNDTSYPMAASGQQRALSFATKPSPTLTQGPMLNIGSPRAGQSVDASFKVKNFGDVSVNVGRVGFAIRDPQGRNVDAGAVNLTINANDEYTFSSPVTFQTPGTYTAWITVTRDGGQTWDDTTYPTAESDSAQRRITFTVKPSPTLTVSPTILTADPRVGKSVTASFTLHNYGDTDVNLGKMSLAARDPRGRNIDFELKSVVVPAGSDYVYTSTNPGTALEVDGTYSALIVRTKDNGASWDDSSYAALDTVGIQRSLDFHVSKSPTLTADPALSITSPHAGQSVTLTYKVKNFGDTPVNMGKLAIAIRDAQGRNVDPAPVAITINANTEYTFSVTTSFASAGNYTAYVTGTDGSRWYDDTFPASESDAVQRILHFTVQP